MTSMVVKSKQTGASARWKAAAAALLVSCAAGITVAEASAPAPTVALTHALLIDGTGRPPVAQATVIIHGSQIAAVGRGITIPAHARVIDLAGRSLLPGFIDAHVHFGGATHIVDFKSTVLGGGTKLIFGGSQFTDNYADARSYSLRYGVTTVRSLGDFLGDILKLRQDTETGVVAGPHIVAAGPSFQVKGGHPNATVWGADPVTVREAARTPASPEEGRRMVDELSGDGVDLIKIILNNRTMMGRGNGQKLPWDVVAAIVKQAHARGLIVAAHVESKEDALEAVNLGVDDIEHLYINLDGSAPAPALDAYNELFRRMVDKGTYFTPTMIISAVHSRQAGGDAGGLHYGNLLVKRAYDMGVKLTVGSDAAGPGTVHGQSLHQELALMVDEEGIPALDAIKAVTRTNAELLGKSRLIGTVEQGKRADLLVVSGNPTQDIRTTQNVQMVFQNGRLVVDNTTRR